MQKLLVANWKENPVTEREALRLFKKIAAIKRRSGIELVICPPLVHLELIAKQFKVLRSKKNIALGAQDVFWKDKGAFTSEIGSLMLRSADVSYVIVGHSERRKLLHETDAMINKKVVAALAAGLQVILCVGEPAHVRKRGVAAAQRFIKNQLKKDLKGVRYQVSGIRKLIVAYEPIWAIGTGKNDSPADAVKMAKFIKTFLLSTFYFLPRVLYGGSVDSKNIPDYVNCKSIDGALVGGASLDAKEFGKMITKISNI
jgi:triosephosphate isomerase